MRSPSGARLLFHQRMPSQAGTPIRRTTDGVLASILWFDSTPRQLEVLTSLFGTLNGIPASGAAVSAPAHQDHRSSSAVVRSSPAATLLRRAVFLTPASVRPYFAVCALEAWRRVPVRQLAGWSGIPFAQLKRLLAKWGLTPAGVAAWNFALHATWLLDVAQLPSSIVVSCMHLGRPAALAAVLGSRGIPFHSGQVQPGAFASTLERYLDLLHAAFRA
jgi:hypothetical protein